MVTFNYSLNYKNYSLENALLWGNCTGHWQKAQKEGRLNHRVVHVIIAAIESLPIIGQIASVFEMMIVTRFMSPLNRLLDDWMNKSGDLENNQAAKNIILEFVTNNKATSLRLHRLKLETLPDIFHLPPFLNRLESLKLNDNKLLTLPESICQLKALKNLDLGFNRLTTLPKSFGKLSELKKLNLNANRLIMLPISFGKLKKLTTLYCSVNSLTSLPDSFGQLSALITLYLNTNKLVKLPESIGQLQELNCLRLSKNNLTSLPASIGQLSKLTDLTLDDNLSLTKVPIEILNLPRFCRIHLLNCPLSSDMLASLEARIKEPGYQGPPIFGFGLGLHI